MKRPVSFYSEGFKLKCVVSVVGIGNGRRWMRSVRRSDEFHDLLARAREDRVRRAVEGKSEFVAREDILLPDRQSAELGAAARRNNPAAVSAIPLEYVDDTLEFNPEWVVDKIAPRPVLKGYGHYQVYAEPAFSDVMRATVAWYREHLPAKV